MGGINRLFLRSKSVVQLLPQVLYGSIMQLLVNEIMPESPEKNLMKFWKRTLELYKEFGTTSKFGNMKMSMFNPKGLLAASILNQALRLS